MDKQHLLATGSRALARVLNFRTRQANRFREVFEERDLGPALEVLDVCQNADVVEARVRLRAGVIPTGLWARRGTEWVPLLSADEIEAQQDGLSCELTIDLSTVHDLLKPDEFQRRILEADDDAVHSAFRFQLYLSVDQESLGSDAPELNKVKNVTEHGVMVPFGRAGQTSTSVFNKIDVADGTVAPYVNRRGVLAVSVDVDAPLFGRVRNDSLSLRNGVLRFEGRLYTRSWVPTGASFVLQGRTSGFRREFGIPLTPMGSTAEEYGLNRYRTSLEADLSPLISEFVDDNLDLYIEVQYAGIAEPYRVRVGVSRYLVRAATEGGWVADAERAVVISPYYTFKAKNPTLRIETFERSAFDTLVESTKNPGKKGSDREIWVIGELPYKAQDNGLHFFKYVRDNHPEIDAYYVIDQDSPERRNLEGYDNVLNFRSSEHIKTLLLADKVISTHNPNFLYPTLNPEYVNKISADRVFLQHGVTAAKWMVPNYGKGASGFKTDLVMVCSEREKQFFVEDFGYDEDEVAVAGFARFDVLLDGSVEVNARQLMVMPTWRPWLQDPDTFAESDYFREWRGLLKSERFRSVVDDLDLEVVLCLHPNMQQYSGLFEEPGIRVVLQGEIDVQYLMKESAVLLTDYSSVAFDFAFLQKPVGYFQFDADRFAQPHADPQTEFPGPICTDPSAVIDFVERSFQNNAEMDPEYRERAKRFLVETDRSYCALIFDAISSFKKSRSVVDDVVFSEVAQLAWRKVRKSKQYLPTMKRLYGIWRRTVPLDANTIVFESSQARHFADSPRAIYERLVETGDQRKKVWIYQGRIHTSDPNTVVVKRHSPAFFWYLATAKYWVNNHNFPNYIHRRKNGVYIQTWHGTPLKRMFMDQDNFFGRDEGYIDRVKEATAQWNHLVSPSEYATNAMRSAYEYTGPVHEIGYPRNDILRRPDIDVIRESVRKRLGIGDDKHVILYAPTFRDDQPTSRGRFYFNWPFDPEEFAEALGPDVVLLVRTHFLVNTKLPIPSHLRGRIKDVADYPDIHELFLASDQLVTDYSSSFFDYSILQKPITFYAYDLANYAEELRGFYLDYKTDLPGPIVEDSESLFRVLNDFKTGDADVTERLKTFSSIYAPYDDGNAAQRTIDLLL